MRKQGQVLRWDEARGFGFIRVEAKSADVFFHARDFLGSLQDRPREGLAVSFEEILVGGKARALSVKPLGAESVARAAQRASAPKPEPRRRSAGAAAPESGAAVYLPLMAAYAAAVGWGIWVHRLDPWVLAILAALNLFTFLAYWQDKYAASKGQWRIKEETLHLWSVAGGWPAAWLAQHLLRHKSRKESFRAAYQFSVALHCCALAGWLLWLAPQLSGAGGLP